MIESHAETTAIRAGEILNIIAAEAIVGESFDLVVIGSGFGSSFYLSEAVKHGLRRVLVVEWGGDHSHAWQLEHGRNSAISNKDTYHTNSDKPWNYTIAFGGGTNCWFAQTPRFHPNDFSLNSLYGVGEDWPLSYNELEPFYAEAEEMMSVSGDPAMATIMPRSKPFPQPPHRLTSADRLMKAAQPDRHFAMPTARARVPIQTRNACCASLRCQLCPADAKFTAQNGLKDLYAHPGVSLCLNTRATRFETTGDVVSALVLEHGGQEYRVRGDRYVLGANAIQSPGILLRSGMDHPRTGVGLHESFGAGVEVFLNGLDHFDGSTITTGLNYQLYDGPHRRESAAALIYFENRWTYGFRREHGRTRQTLPLVIVTEDLLRSENCVVLEHASASHPNVIFAGASDYARRGLDRALSLLPEVLAPLPIERIAFRGIRATESHLQGTLRMGRNPEASVVDERQVHHRWRNLTVVGSAVFPSCSCANPSLTVAALSLRAARLAVDGA
ncbi:GMC oxidoreductase [Microvirga sp. 3-52]|uniref:GMC oxidoreductase n=1 Tax=Microvirga sp. 3-52 TaxID=2792425 RepID=UPI0020C1556E|nr:GMC family oxidoreductase [Microvirga sp. 3-52]